MIHFGTLPVGHTSVWGQTVNEPEQDFENDLARSQISRTHKALVLSVGQRLGGIGFYRTETNQPRFNAVDGAYAFDTYLTTYSYADGQYSFALEVWVSLNETLNLGDASTQNLILQEVLTEALTLTDTWGYGSIFPVSLAENLSLNDVVAAGAIYAILLPESLLLSTVDTTTGGASSALVAYAVNANTGAVSTYTNFNFNSFAKLNGRYLAADATGIFELAGTSDAGAAINASVTLPTTEFSTDQVAADSLKRLPTVYLGVNTAGDMMLKVTANGADNFYTLSGTTTTSLHTGRMLLGKGVAARYWDFELTNVSGADFTLESITFYPVALTRRIVRG